MTAIAVVAICVCCCLSALTKGVRMPSFLPWEWGCYCASQGWYDEPYSGVCQRPTDRRQYADGLADYRRGVAEAHSAAHHVGNVLRAAERRLHDDALALLAVKSRRRQPMEVAACW